MRKEEEGNQGNAFLFVLAFGNNVNLGMLNKRLTPSVTKTTPGGTVGSNLKINNRPKQ